MSGEGGLLVVRIPVNDYCARHFEDVLDSLQSRLTMHRCTPSVPMEMRKEIRYRLDAPALFSWESVHHRRLQGEGITRDISVLGAFIQTPTCPPAQTPIQVEVILRSLTGMKDIRIKGEALVIRVEHPYEGQGENGFAVVRGNLNNWSLATGQDESEDTRIRELSMAVETDRK